MPIGRIGQEFIINTTVTGDQFATSLTALADGRFVMTWSSFDPGDGSGQCVRGRVFNADGSPAGADFIVNSTTTSTQQLPSVTALPDGRFVVTWTSFDAGDGSGSCIRARVFNADGSPEGSDFIVNSTSVGGQADVSVTALADGFVVTWGSEDAGDGSGECIRARVFDADGNPTGDDFIVNTTTTSDQLFPTVTALADGGFVVTWESTDPGDGSGECIRARVFDADGDPAGDDFIVNTTTTDDQVDVSVTALVDGGYVVTWQSIDAGDGSGTCIRGRVFDADGNPTGDDFIVNSTVTNDQTRPEVTALADGRFVVTWQSEDGGDGDGIGVRARVFNADGSPAGDDFIVNTTGTDSQFDPSTTALADGRFVVTWTSDGSEDGSGNSVHAQIFDPTIFIGTAAVDTWQGGSLADTINGGGNGDILSGLGGDDVINGDAGFDTLSGGDGNDRLYGGTDNDALNGNAGTDTLFGNAGGDTMNGGAGADAMSGGTATTPMSSTMPATPPSEAAGSGTDTVQSTVTFTLAANVENLMLNGAAAINGTGNASANAITGNSAANVLSGLGDNDTLTGFGGDDRLDGGTGADAMTGGNGNDTYVVDNAGDTASEAAGSGVDIGAEHGHLHARRRHREPRAERRLRHQRHRQWRRQHDVRQFRRQPPRRQWRRRHDDRLRRGGRLRLRRRRRRRHRHRLRQRLRQVRPDRSGRRRRVLRPDRDRQRRHA